jgi:hypothetical protein
MQQKLSKIKQSAMKILCPLKKIFAVEDFNVTDTAKYDCKQINMEHGKSTE